MRQSNPSSTFSSGAERAVTLTAARSFASHRARRAVLTALSLCGSLTLGRADFADTFHHRIHGAPLTTVDAGFLDVQVRHTWANSHSYDDSFDQMQSFKSGEDNCQDANSASGCGAHYLGSD